MHQGLIKAMDMRDLTNVMAGLNLSRISARMYWLSAIDHSSNWRPEKRNRSADCRAFLWHHVHSPGDQHGNLQVIRPKLLESMFSSRIVDTRYTSPKCSNCEHTTSGNRERFVFHCHECGIELHADPNASRIDLLRAYLA